MAKPTPLGLPDDAPPEDVEARYAELTAFLRSSAVPASLRSWAQEQLALVDEFYASGEGEEWEETPAPQARPPRKSKAERRPQRGPAPRAEAGPAQWSVSVPQDWVVRIGAGVLAGMVVVAVIFGFLAFRGNGEPEQRASIPPVGGQPVELDEARVAELQAVLAQQPENQAALFELGELYFTAAEWQPAIDWFTKLVALDPTDTHALTDIGTANFNLGQPQEAKIYWERVLEVDPMDVQAHYNMGFYYANVEPRDLESAIREWQAVVDLDPNSSLAQTARVHIEGLRAEATPQAPVPEAEQP